MTSCHYWDAFREALTLNICHHSPQEPYHLQHSSRALPYIIYIVTIEQRLLTSTRKLSMSYSHTLTAQYPSESCRKLTLLLYVWDGDVEFLYLISNTSYTGYISLFFPPLSFQNWLTHTQESPQSISLIII